MKLLRYYLFKKSKTCQHINQITILPVIKPPLKLPLPSYFHKSQSIMYIIWSQNSLAGRDFFLTLQRASPNICRHFQTNLTPIILQRYSIRNQDENICGQEIYGSSQTLYYLIKNKNSIFLIFLENNLPLIVNIIFVQLLKFFLFLFLSCILSFFCFLLPSFSLPFPFPFILSPSLVSFLLLPFPSPSSPCFYFPSFAIFLFHSSLSPFRFSSIIFIS